MKLSNGSKFDKEYRAKKSTGKPNKETPKQKYSVKYVDTLGKLEINAYDISDSVQSEQEFLQEVSNLFIKKKPGNISTVLPGNILFCGTIDDAESLEKFPEELQDIKNLRQTGIEKIEGEESKYLITGVNDKGETQQIKININKDNKTYSIEFQPEATKVTRVIEETVTKPKAFSELTPEEQAQFIVTPEYLKEKIDSINNYQGRAQGKSAQTKKDLLEIFQNNQNSDAPKTQYDIAKEVYDHFGGESMTGVKKKSIERFVGEGFFDILMDQVQIEEKIQKEIEEVTNSCPINISPRNFL